MKILIMNRKYDGVFGGVEKMSTILANAMARRGHQCHIVSLDPESAEMHYDLHTDIQWHKISKFPAGQKAGWGERFSRFKKIRNIIKAKNIDIAIGFQDGAYLSLVTAALGTGVPVVAAERNSPSRFDYIKAGRFKGFTFNSFRLARAVTVQCQSYVQKYPSYLRHKIEVVPNPVFPSDVQVDLSGNTRDRKRILSVGRLSYQKNYTVLVNAFSKLSGDFQDWDLVIVGDGEARAELESQINDLKLSERVFLTGYKDNPSEHYLKADIFCLPSRWEGFPNALVEAMAHGLPCVGFEGCSGVCDLIEHQETGSLVKGNGDGDLLSEAIRGLMIDKDLRIKMGQRSIKSIAQYEPEKVFNMWEALFKRIKK